MGEIHPPFRRNRCPKPGQLTHNSESHTGTSLVVANNLSHNVPALLGAAKNRLTDLAIIYLGAEVAGHRARGGLPRLISLAVYSRLSRLIVHLALVAPGTTNRPVHVCLNTSISSLLVAEDPRRDRLISGIRSATTRSRQSRWQH